MRKWIPFLALLILISSCKEKEQSPLDGIWVTVYTQLGNSKKFPSYSRNLLEFQDTAVLVTAIGDLASMKFEKIDQRTMNYEWVDSTFNLAGDQYKISFGADSLVLRPVGSESTKIVFKRLAENLKNTLGSKKDFTGNFEWSENGQEFDFVSESILLPKRAMEGIEFPAEGWNIMEYKGYRFLNIHNEMFGLALIESSDSKNIHLLKNNIIFQKIHLKKSNLEQQNKRKQFLGKWKSNNLREVNSQLNLEIKKDELNYQKDSLSDTMEWQLNSSGSRIFFPGFKDKKRGAWKVLELNENQMTLEMFGLGDIPNNISIVVFEKIDLE